MKKMCVLVLIAFVATSSFATVSCCSADGPEPKKDGSTSVAGDGVITREQLDESIAALQRMKARIPPGQDSIPIREVMIMQMEEIQKSPEYVKMPEDEIKRLDAAIEAARRPSAATTREEGAKKPAATGATHETVELSDGKRAFFMPKQRARPVSARKRRK